MYFPLLTMVVNRPCYQWPIARSAVPVCGDKRDQAAVIRLIHFRWGSCSVNWSFVLQEYNG